MSKKISELEKAYAADRKEIETFLQSKGIAADKGLVDDSAEKLVSDRFGKRTASPDAKPKSPAAGVHPVKKKKIIIVTNNGGSSSGRSGSYSSGQGRKPQQGQGPRTGRGGARPQQGGQRAAAGTGTYHPIKPKTQPTQMQMDYHAPEEPRREQAKRVVNKEPEKTAVMPEKVAPAAQAAPAAPAPEVREKPQAAAPAKPAAAEPAAKPAAAPQEKPVQEKAQKERPERRVDSTVAAVQASQAKPRPTHYDLSKSYFKTSTKSSQGGTRSSTGTGRSYSSRPGQARSYQSARPGQSAGNGFRGRGPAPQGGSTGRGTRPGQGRSGQGGEGNAAFGSENRRRGYSSQGRDRRNKKDVAFAEDEQREKKNRSGRFIKPVVEEKKAPEEQIKVITIPEKLTIRDLAEAMHMQPAEIIKKLFLSGKMTTVNTEITYEEAENIAADYDILCEKEEKVDEIQQLLAEDEDDPATLKDRPPVIVVMGHVDHGKTSLLDYIRHTKVTDKEAGGITQAIGAYTVDVKGRTITFLDTPGHESFTAMRLRGAQATDIAVLVVAADDGVMPQTVEAINHARAAGVEIIVAINKIDKPGANPDRVKEQLSKYELIPTDWGGSTEFVEVSAKTGQGIDDLLETILLQADVMELKANPDRLARGVVLEAKLDKGRGPVANVLVQKGTLHVGDFISAGAASGKVRALINDKGRNVKQATPSFPVMVLGLSDVPSAGEVLVAHATNDEAKQYAETYKAQHKEELVEENRMSMNVEDLFDQMREGKMKELELIVKADVQGSVEALCQSLLKLSNDEVMVKIIHSAVGNITESDVNLAEASNAAIIGFNVHPDATAKSIAEHGGVSIHLYKVIYECIDDVDAALKGMLAPVYEEKVIGHAEVRQIFKSGKIGNIAGSMVLDGVVEKGCQVRITRGKDQIFEGALASLKRFKDDVKEVKAGYDCGLVFQDFDAIQEGDQIECYKMVEVPREQVIARKEAEKKAAEKAAKAASAQQA